MEEKLQELSQVRTAQAQRPRHLCGRADGYQAGISDVMNSLPTVACISVTAQGRSAARRSSPFVICVTKTQRLVIVKKAKNEIYGRDIRVVQKFGSEVAQKFITGGNHGLI